MEKLMSCFHEQLDKGFHADEAWRIALDVYHSHYKRKKQIDTLKDLKPGRKVLYLLLKTVWEIESPYNESDFGYAVIHYKERTEGFVPIEGLRDNKIYQILNEGPFDATKLQEGDYIWHIDKWVEFRGLDKFGNWMTLYHGGDVYSAKANEKEFQFYPYNEWKTLKPGRKVLNLFDDSRQRFHVYELTERDEKGLIGWKALYNGDNIFISDASFYDGKIQIIPEGPFSIDSCYEGMWVWAEKNNSKFVAKSGWKQIKNIWDKEYVVLRAGTWNYNYDGTCQDDNEDGARLYFCPPDIVDPLEKAVT